MPRASQLASDLVGVIVSERHGGHPATGHAVDLPSVSRRMSMSVPAVVSAAMVIIVFPPGIWGSSLTS